MLTHDGIPTYVLCMYMCVAGLGDVDVDMVEEILQNQLDQHPNVSKHLAKGWGGGGAKCILGFSWSLHCV